MENQDHNNQELHTTKRPLFDMYYFKSRIDVLLIAVLVLFFILAALVYFFSGSKA